MEISGHFYPVCMHSRGKMIGNGHIQKNLALLSGKGHQIAITTLTWHHHTSLSQCDPLSDSMIAARASFQNTAAK